jgi:FtsH-binding integral membrane protein
MPGQLMIPLYGLVFQGARAEKPWSCGLAGFSASVLHVLYGVILAPMIFSVAPATAILSLVRGHAPDFGSAIAICAVAFGLGGMLSADIGRRLGIRIGATPGACVR